MVGDGVNDAPALARPTSASPSAPAPTWRSRRPGVVLASSDPRPVLSVIILSEAAYRKMQQNLWWAAGYNLISVPLAAGVLAPIGFVLPMSVGAILMSAVDGGGRAQRPAAAPARPTARCRRSVVQPAQLLAQLGGDRLVGADQLELVARPAPA